MFSPRDILFELVEQSDTRSGFDSRISRAAGKRAYSRRRRDSTRRILFCNIPQSRFAAPNIPFCKRNIAEVLFYFLSGVLSSHPHPKAKKSTACAVLFSYDSNSSFLSSNNSKYALTFSSSDHRLTAAGAASRS